MSEIIEPPGSLRRFFGRFAIHRRSRTCYVIELRPTAVGWEKAAAMSEPTIAELDTRRAQLAIDLDAAKRRDASNVGKAGRT